MPGKICKGNGLSETCCHLSEVRARRLRLDRVNALGLISSQFHRFPPKTWNRGTPWNSRSTPGSLAAQGLRGNRGTVEQNFQKLPRNLHIYITRTNVHIYVRSYICCIFCSTVPHPTKKVVESLAAQGLRGNRGTVEQNFQKLPRNLHIYITRTNVHIYVRSYICCIFCSTVPHPTKKVVESLAAQGLRAVEPVFHARSSCSTLQRQFIRIFLVIQLHGGQPQAEAFRGDTIDTLPLGVGTPAGLNQGFLLQV